MSQNIIVSSPQIDGNFIGQRSNKMASDTSQIDKEFKAPLADQNTVNESRPVADKESEVNQKSTSQAFSDREIEEALTVVSDFMSATSKNIDFSNDSSSGKTIIKIFDKDTKELISQFPSDKIISMAEKIKNLHQEIESTSGLLIDNHV